MICAYILLALLICWRARLAPHGRFRDDCLTRESTTPIKGIFILWVFICHAMGYLMESGYEFSSIGDRLFWGLCAAPRQLTVVIFLFYSGYGVMESFRVKGIGYVNQMPRRRLLKTLVNFDIAVLAFVALDIIIGKAIGARQLLLSFIGWESVGNSNWYIFTILICYICAFASLKITCRPARAVKLLFALLTIFAVVISFVRETWWYDTVMAFPVGALVSLRKDQILSFLKRRYAALLVLCGLTVVGLHIIPFSTTGVVANAKAMVFAILVLMLTMKLRIGNNFLNWCGDNLFFIYIYQRLPMMAMSYLDVNAMKAHPSAFMAIGFVCTIMIAAGIRAMQRAILTRSTPK